MDHYFRAEIKAVVVLPDEYLAYILQAHRMHAQYFIEEIKNRREFRKKALPDRQFSIETFTCQEIEIIIKAIEFPSTDLARKLRAELLTILDGMNIVRNHNIHLLKTTFS